MDAFYDECEMYEEFLSLNGFQVLRFDAPQPAFEAAERVAPDAIITHLRQNNDEMDGIALTAKLRCHPGTCDIPVVVITTSILAEDRKAAEQAGANAYLLLPLTPDALLKEIRAMLEARPSDSAERE